IHDGGARESGHGAVPGVRAEAGGEVAMRARFLVGIVAVAAAFGQQRPAPQGLYGDFRVEGEHVLALDAGDAAIAASREQHRTYRAHEELGDPKGFAFIATNNNGVYDIGDRVPMIARTRLVGTLPAAARIRIVHGGATAAEASGVEINF